MNKLETCFQKMKAKVKVTHDNRNRGGYTVDVKNGVFLINLSKIDAKVTLLQADIKDRHVLLNVQYENEVRKGKNGIINEIINDKWLCGHDERDWFVGSIPVGVNTIIGAKQSLKPQVVRDAEKILKKKHLHKRRNKAFLRQGEWFFVPVGERALPVNPVIHKDEPISRGGGSKPHIVEELVRIGGRTVYVRGAEVLSEEAYGELPGDSKRGYSMRMADATVYARGYVKHKDHATLQLKGWHQVLMNTERSSKALIFLD